MFGSQPLQFGRILKFSATLAFSNREHLAVVTAIPIIGLTALSTIPSDVPGDMSLLLLPLKCILWTLLAVTTHRLSLLGPAAVENTYLQPWGTREWHFALQLFLTTVLGAVILVPLSIWQVGPAGKAIGIFAACYLIGRLLLLFPAIAADHETSFTTSWFLSSENSLCLTAVTLMLILPLQFIPTLLGTVLPPILSVPLIIASHAFAIVGIVTLSVCYHTLLNSVRSAALSGVRTTHRGGGVL